MKKLANVFIGFVVAGGLILVGLVVLKWFYPGSLPFINIHLISKFVKDWVVLITWSLTTILGYLCINGVVVRSAPEGKLYKNLWRRSRTELADEANDAQTTNPDKLRGFAGAMLRKEPEDVQDPEIDQVLKHPNLGEQWALFCLSESRGTFFAGHPIHGYSYMMFRIIGFSDGDPADWNMKKAGSNAGFAWLNVMVVLGLFLLFSSVVQLLMSDNTELMKYRSLIALVPTAFVSYMLVRKELLGWFITEKTHCDHLAILGDYAGTYSVGLNVRFPLIGSVVNTSQPDKTIVMTDPDTKEKAARRTNDPDKVFCRRSIFLGKFPVNVADGAFDALLPTTRKAEGGRTPKTSSSRVNYVGAAVMEYSLPVFAVFGIRGDLYNLSLGYVVSELYDPANRVAQGDLTDREIKMFTQASAAGGLQKGEPLDLQAHAHYVRAITNKRLEKFLMIETGMSFEWTRLVFDFNAMMEGVRGKEEIASIEANALRERAKGEADADRERGAGRADSDRKRIEALSEKGGVPRGEAARLLVTAEVAQKVGTLTVIAPEILGAGAGIGAAAAVAGATYTAGSRTAGGSGGAAPTGSSGSGGGTSTPPRTGGGGGNRSSGGPSRGGPRSGGSPGSAGAGAGGSSAAGSAGPSGSAAGSGSGGGTTPPAGGTVPTGGSGGGTTPPPTTP